MNADTIWTGEADLVDERHRSLVAAQLVHLVREAGTQAHVTLPDGASHQLGPGAHVLSSG